MKCVVFFQGLNKINHLCGTEFIANTKKDKNIIKGLIYKYNRDKYERYLEKGTTFNV